MTLEELKSLQPGDVVVITKVDEYLNNGTTSKDYYVGEEMAFLICKSLIMDEIEWVDFLRHSNPDKPAEFHVEEFLNGKGTIAHFGHGVHDYIERKVKLERERKLTDLGI